MPRYTMLRAISTLTAAFAFILVVWGGIVRINGAGMTCPDWPRCRGVWLPALNGSVFYEFAHRFGATILTLLIISTFVLAFRDRENLRAAMKFAWALLGLILVQIAVGAFTIRYANSPGSVAIHLVVGVATFAVSSMLAYCVFERIGGIPVAESATPASRLFAFFSLLSTIFAFGTIFAGGFMSASHAGLACQGFPLCNGWLPSHDAMQRIHMAHRFAAYATLVLVVVLAGVSALVKTQRPELRKLVAAAVVLVTLQVTLGVITVISGLEPVLRSVHQANGALLAALLALLTYRAFSREALAQAPSAPTEHRSLEPGAVEAGAWSTIRNYIALTKLNVMSLLLFTTLTSMMMAARGFPSAALVFFTLLGGALASASSASINMYLDRDIDAQMSRTRLRPIPSGRVAPRNALVFGIILGLLAATELALTVNWLAALLSTIGIIYYVVIYTMWLKRTTPQNIVVGGAAGSIPPLVGWAAVTHHLGLTALLLFLIIFVWTPPHFWSLALMKTNEYKRVGIPMLPAVRGEAETKRQIIGYTLLLVALTMVMVPLHLMGSIYLVCALVLDGLFVAGAIWVATVGTKRSEALMYRFSMLYLALLFGAMVIDRFGRGGV